MEDTIKGDANMKYNQSIGWKDYEDWNHLFLSEKANTVAQCLFSIQYVGEIESEITQQIKEME